MLKCISKRLNKKGFTLVELLVVIAIIGILAAVIAPNAFKAVEKGKVAAAEADYKAIKSAALNYYTDTGVWPVDGSDDVGFVTKPTTSTSPAVTAEVSNAWNGPYLERWPSKSAWGGSISYNVRSATGNITNTTVGQNYKYLFIEDVPRTSAVRLDNDLDGTEDSDAGVVQYVTSNGISDVYLVLSSE